MNKQQFIEILQNKLKNLPKKEIEDRINFYSEIIDDKIEDGVLEENAVRQLGDIDELASKISAEIPFTSIIKEKIKLKRKLNAWEILLIALGAPILFSLLISLFAVVFSVYLSLWAGTVALWAGVFSLCAMTLYGIIYGGIMMLVNYTFVNLAIFSIGLISVGLAIMLLFASKFLTKILLIFPKKCIFAIKSSFVNKENE